MPAIVAQDLTKRFADLTAVNNVSFSVDQGEIFGFLGPNGSGKSTVIKLLCGLLQPNAGTGQVEGFDIVRESDKIRENTGYMSQRFSLYPDLTVLENITFYGKVYGLQGERLKRRRQEVLQMLQLEERQHQLAATLSGGWKQRLALAVAILHEPKVMFLDEPTAGIDPVARRELWDLFFEFSSQGRTLFVTTHYMDEAERCTSVGYIYMSHLIVRGQPSELKQLPDVTPEGTRRIEVKCDHITSGLEVMRRAPYVRDATIFGQLIHLLIDAHINLKRIRETLAEAGMGSIETREVDPSLEDVFVTLTRKIQAERRKAAVSPG
ncbi:ABC transporter ATP-binding protein [Acidobacteria bacterium AH-259-L09]|nr:ABC transporter ATP-binding protein [Acidobacteria bacterium AH-259-L09]